MNSRYLRNSHNINQKGFSLIEMLVVIAVIGIMAAIALAALGPRFEGFSEARDRRNAQSLAAISLAAQSAGLDFVVPADVEATVRAVVVGGSPAEGAMQSSWFGVPGMEDEAILDSLNFLSLENGILVYDSGY